jgi:hypothetical protein
LEQLYFQNRAEFHWIARQGDFSDIEEVCNRLGIDVCSPRYLLQGAVLIELIEQQGGYIDVDYLVSELTDFNPTDYVSNFNDFNVFLRGLQRREEATMARLYESEAREKFASDIDVDRAAADEERTLREMNERAATVTAEADQRNLARRNTEATFFREMAEYTARRDALVEFRNQISNSITQHGSSASIRQNVTELTEQRTTVDALGQRALDTANRMVGSEDGSMRDAWISSAREISLERDREREADRILISKANEYISSEQLASSELLRRTQQVAEQTAGESGTKTAPLYSSILSTLTSILSGFFDNYKIILFLSTAAASFYIFIKVNFSKKPSLDTVLNTYETVFYNDLPQIQPIAPCCLLFLILLVLCFLTIFISFLVVFSSRSNLFRGGRYDVKIKT